MWWYSCTPETCQSWCWWYSYCAQKGKSRLPVWTALGSYGRKWLLWGQEPPPTERQCGKIPQGSSSSALISADPSPINTHKTMTGISGTLVIIRLGALAGLLTLPCSRVWSKDGPSCKVKWAAALYTEASRAVCQEPVSALSNLFPIWEEHTFYIPDAFTYRRKRTIHMQTWYFVAIYFQYLCAYHFEALQ